jgi:hypothetical protein
MADLGSIGFSAAPSVVAAGGAVSGTVIDRADQPAARIVRLMSRPAERADPVVELAITESSAATGAYKIPRPDEASFPFEYARQGGYLVLVMDEPTETEPPLNALVYDRVQPA